MDQNDEISIYSIFCLSRNSPNPVVQQPPSQPQQPRPQQQQPGTTRRSVKTFSDFDADENLFSQIPANPVDVRRKFLGHDKKVKDLGMVARKMKFAEFHNLPREFF